jgi:hypothetical protein
MKAKLRRMSYALWFVLASVTAAGAEVRLTTTSVDGSPIKQVMAESVVDVPAGALLAVLSDAEHYASFIPYVVESTILARDGESVVNYQRLDFRILGVDPRHYVIRMRTASGTGPGGRAVYQIRWALVPEAKLPEAPAAVALTVDNGFWHLEDLGGEPARTRVVYCVFTDPGGKLPAWVINQANAQAVPRLFDAVQKAARAERYRTIAGTSAPHSTLTLEAPASCHA